MENLLKALNANLVIRFECFPRIYDREKYIPEKHIFASFVTRVKDKILLSVNFSLPTLHNLKYCSFVNTLGSPKFSL